MSNSWEMKSGASEQPANDTYFARIVGVVNLGKQPGFMYNGEMQAPENKSEITYELVTTSMEDGRPFHISEQVNMKKGTEAKATKRFNAVGVEIGNFPALLNKTVMVTTELNKNGYANVKGVAAAPSGMDVPELRNAQYAFSIFDEDPDMTLFESFSNFRQSKIKAALDFEGTELHKRILADATSDL